MTCQGVCVRCACAHACVMQICVCRSAARMRVTCACNMGERESVTLSTRTKKRERRGLQREGRRTQRDIGRMKETGRGMCGSPLMLKRLKTHSQSPPASFYSALQYPRTHSLTSHCVQLRVLVFSSHSHSYWQTIRPLHASGLPDIRCRQATARAWSGQAGDG